MSNFRRIITAVHRMPRLIDPTGRPDVNAENLEMRLEMLNLNVSVFRTIIWDPLHQVDHGLFGTFVWDRSHCCLHHNVAANIDRAAADECCHRYLARPP